MTSSSAGISRAFAPGARRPEWHIGRLLAACTIACAVSSLAGCAARWNGPEPPVLSRPNAELLRPGRVQRLPTERFWTYKHSTFLGAAPQAVGAFLATVDHKGKVLFLDPNSGKLKASAKVKSALHDAPVWDEERFYLVQSAPRRRLEAFRFKDGKKSWRHDFTHSPSAPIKIGEELLLAAGDTVFALSPVTGDILRIVTSGGGRWQRPVVSDSGLLLSTSGGLLRLVAPDGGVRWEKALELALADPPVATADGYYVAGSAGLLVKLSPSGNEIWRDTISDAPVYPPGVRSGEVFAVSASGAVVALESATGQRLWQHKLGAPGARGLCVRDTWLAVNSVDGILWLLDLESGAVKDTLRFDELIHEPPVWAFGRLYVVTENKKLHALGTRP